MIGGLRDAFTPAEVEEIRGLLDGLEGRRMAERRIAMARLRHMGLAIAAHAGNSPTLKQFEALLAGGELKSDPGAVGHVQPKKIGDVFRVSVGVAEEPVGPDWNTFDHRFQWFGRSTRSLSSGAHLFVLAVGHPWRSAVVGLYEAISGFGSELPGSPNPERWPWAVGVRPLAAIPPPDGVRIEGLYGPQNGLPNKVDDPDDVQRLYEAIAASPPPPGPTTEEQRVQELEWPDVLPDVLEAVKSLGTAARKPVIISRAIEIGGWNEDELKARAWHTGNGEDSHIRFTLDRALLLRQGKGRELDQVHSVFTLNPEVVGTGFGAPYRPADEGSAAVAAEMPPHLADLAELDRATQRHMKLQDRLAEALGERGIEPLSPAPGQPQFDLAFEHGGRRFVVEVKSGDPVSLQQVRLGVGQVLEYGRLLGTGAAAVDAGLLLEAEPPFPWPRLAGELGVGLLRADDLHGSLDALLA
jgi:hypothetical protein